MKDLIGMIPGIGKAIKDIDINDDAFKHVEAIIHSMTIQERHAHSLTLRARWWWCFSDTSTAPTSALQRWGNCRRP